MLGEVALKAIEAKKDKFEQLALKMWEHPEVGYNEVYASKEVAALARELGFEDVQVGAYDLPTCVVARWGKEGPAVGYLGELDALPGLSQKVQTTQEPVAVGAAGQGCGHNLLAVSCLAAAYGAMEELKASGKPGRVVYYGCPAEELLTGKVFMARAGAFKDLDIAFSWHGNDRNSADCFGHCSAMNTVKFHFHGRTAHAGGDPHNGRSALDAVELTNVGANYLREHVTSDVRIHYTITEGGTAPNIVPDRASVWYFVRAMSRAAVEDTYERLCEVARGAARMTGTKEEIEFLGGCYDTMNNDVLTNVVLSCMNEIGAPQWTDDEKKFAAELNKRSPFYDPAKHDAAPICDVVDPRMVKQSFGSTDVGDVQHIVPCAMMGSATYTAATPGHSWMITACAGHSIGLKGMLFGAKSMAMATMRAVDDPKIIEAAKKEFKESMAGASYKCPITPDVPVPQPKAASN